MALLSGDLMRWMWSQWTSLMHVLWHSLKRSYGLCQWICLIGCWKHIIVQVQVSYGFKSFGAAFRSHQRSLLFAKKGPYIFFVLTLIMVETKDENRKVRQYHSCILSYLNGIMDIHDAIDYSSFAIGMCGAFILMLWPERKFKDIERHYDIHFRIK